MRKHVVHLIASLEIGGAEMMLKKIVKNMDNEKFENTIICLSSRGEIGQELIEEGFQVLELGFRKKKLISIFRIIFNYVLIIRKAKPDFIISWMYNASFITILLNLLKPKNTKVIWNVRHALHDLRHEKKTTAIIIKIMSIFSSKIPSKIIYNSEKSKESHEKMGFNKNRGIVLPNGFETNTFKLNSKFKKDGSIFYIGMVGRYHPMKDYDNFLRAASILSKINNNVRYILVGRNVDSLNDELIRKLRIHKLMDYVELLGEQKEINTIIHRFDIATLSSYTESFPNVIGESMLCGVPCVSTNVGGVSDLIGPYGIVVPPHSPEELANGWINMIGLNSSERINLGLKGREHIIANYSIKTITNRFQLILSE